MSSTPVQRAITEAIEAAASTEARVSILIRALGRSGLARVPERGPEVLRFLEGPLLDALIERLGPTVATEIGDQLRPVLRMASRGSNVAPSRTSRPPPSDAGVEPRPTLRVIDPARFDALDGETPKLSPIDSSGVRPTPMRPLPERDHASHTAATRRMEQHKDEAIPPAAVFVLATLDDALTAAVEQLPNVRVRRVRGLFELVDASDEARDRITTLVFDCSQPPVHVASLLALAADMPEPMQVAVIGATKLDLSAIYASPERTIGWHYLDRMTAAELAAKIAVAARAFGG
ncbi:MAG: hypothetical protein J0L92_39395 [Deltaproteobacteria bacterium]|nr:hypothetical protein [Deltaproteobacteria bacterium]